MQNSEEKLRVIEVLKARIDAYFGKQIMSVDDFQLHGVKELSQLSKALEPKYVDKFELSALEKLFKISTGAYFGIGVGNVEGFTKVIQELSSDPNFEKGELGVPFLEDIVLDTLPELSGDVRDRIVSRLGEFFARHLKIVTDPLLKFTLSNTFLIIVRKNNNVLRDIQLLYYVNSPDYDGGEWGRQYVPVIKQNQELLGTKQINIAGLQVAQTVEHWIQDYVGFTQKPDGQREPLDRLNFLNKAPNVKLLTTEERQLLLKVLEVFDWFCDPYVTKEVVEYFEGPQDESASVNVAEPDEELEDGELSASSAFQEQPVVEQASAPQRPPLTANVEEETKKSESTLKQGQPPSGLPVKPEKKTSLPTTSKSEVAKNKPVKFTMPDLDEKELPEPPSEMFLKPASEDQSALASPSKTPVNAPSLVKEVKALEDGKTFQEKKQSKDSQKLVVPPGVKMPSLAKPLERKTKLPPLKLPKTLGDLSTLKQSAQNKKQQVQSDIDQRLNNLNEELDN